MRIEFMFRVYNYGLGQEFNWREGRRCMAGAELQ